VTWKNPNNRREDDLEQVDLEQVDLEQVDLEQVDLEQVDLDILVDTPGKKNKKEEHHMRAGLDMADHHSRVALEQE